MAAIQGGPLIRLFPFVLVMALCGSAAAEEITPLSVLFAHKAKYEGKFACVLGKTSYLFAKPASRNGNPYFTVWINDGDFKIKVFGFGSPKAFVAGDEIEACGKYEQVKKISNRIFYDEFTANVIMKGAAMRSGLVDIGPDGRFALKVTVAHSDLVQVTTNMLRKASPASTSPPPSGVAVPAKTP
jgi:hypothetical protein